MGFPDMHNIYVLLCSDIIVIPHYESAFLSYLSLFDAYVLSVLHLWAVHELCHDSFIADT